MTAFTARTKIAIVVLGPVAGKAWQGGVVRDLTP